MLGGERTGNYQTGRLVPTLLGFGYSGGFVDVNERADWSLGEDFANTVWRSPTLRMFTGSAKCPMTPVYRTNSGNSRVQSI